MRISLAAACVAALFAAGTHEARSASVEPLPPQPSGSGDITLKVDAYTHSAIEGGKLVEKSEDAVSASLDYVKVVRFIDLEGNAEVRYLFSADPVEDLRLADPLGESDYTDWRKGRDSNSIYLVAPENGSGSFSGLLHPVSGFQVDHAFNEIRFDDQQAAGELAIENSAGVHWTASGSFRAPLSVVHAVPPVTGENVLGTAQVRCVMNAMGQLGKGDPKGLKPYVTKGAYADLVDLLKQASEAEIDDIFQAFGIEPAKLEALFRSGDARLYVAGDRAKVEYSYQDDDGSTTSGSFRLLWEDGKWLMN